MARSQLPDGTVTFLFTDIEGSTRLLDDLGEEGYVEALGEHRRLLRGALSAQGGVEVDTQGDAFLYAFAEPAQALAAAAAGQAALESGPIKVRMGLHTGEPRLTGEGYAGRELHRAARIAASGHGGQVVVSAATRALVDGELTELGEHRLKDFDEPVPLFQLGQERFPPLKTISNTNLPRPASSFVGRQRERDELVELLGNGTRLVTLSGPGGSGKTRLGIEAAAELVPSFKAGVFWVGLSALREPALVSEEIAQTLGAKDGLAEHIGERELLLLLDNFEQVVEAAPELAQLLERCPNLKLLVTSRELLRIRGEVEYPVPTLAEPEAVELFCARSRLEPDETIAELCRRLDELPLALELAAARTSVLSPAQILDRLGQRLDLLRGGRDVEARQQTLRATIEWSYDLLEPSEKRLFARLAVFRGGCSLEAAEQVCDADLDVLQSLVEKSLVRATAQRFWMLETIRTFARERLAESADEAELRRRYAGWYLRLAEARFQEMAVSGDRAVVLARLDAEQDNLRAVLAWADDRGEDEVLLRLVAAICQYWLIRDLAKEMDIWLSLALERGSSPAAARMEVLHYSAARAVERREWARSEALIAELCRIAEREGDEPQALGAMHLTALNALGQGDLDAAHVRLVEIGERAAEIGDGRMVAIATHDLGCVAIRSGDFEAALDYSRKAAELFRARGGGFGLAFALGNAGWSSLGLSEPARAGEYFREEFAELGRIGAIRSEPACSGIVGLAAALIALHQEERGAQLLAAAARLRDELGPEVGFEDEHEQQSRERALAEAKAALGEQAFAAAWARGEAVPPEEIVALALAE
jgi:predicted ATPase